MRYLIIILGLIISIQLNGKDELKFVDKHEIYTVEYKNLRMVEIDPIERVEMPMKIESTAVVGGIPVVDVLGNALETLIQIAATGIEIVGKTRRGIQGLIEKGTSAVRDIKEEWYNSLEIVNQFVSDYKAIESIVNQSADIIQDSYKFLNDIQSYEYIEQNIGKLGIKEIESQLKKSRSYISDLENVLNSGKLTDAERLNIIDLIEQKVAKSSGDIASLSVKMKEFDVKAKSTKKTKTVYNNFFLNN